MRKLSAFVILSGGCACLWMGAARAQFGRGDGGWSTSGGDAQRSSWVRTDPRISTDSLLKPGFQLVWKLKLNNEPKQLNGLTPPPLLDRYIGIKGFRSLGFVGGSSDNIYAVDTDLGRTDWQTHFTSSSAQKESTLTCPGGMTANTARPVGTAFPAAPAAGRGGGGGRGTPAKSAVGEPGEGGVTVAEIAARTAAMAAANPGSGAGANAGRGAGANPGRGAGAGRGGNAGRRVPVVVYVLSSDGMLHAMYVSNGVEPEPPVAFLPANANAQGLSIVDNVAYVATTAGCGGAPNALWALDLVSKQVVSWKSISGGIAGTAGAAFGPDGTLYVATSEGDLVSLEAKTLKVKDVYRAGQEFTSSPVIFQYKEKALLALTTKDGRIQLLDTAAMSAPPARTPPYTTATDFAPGALASWQSADGTRWILGPAAGPISPDAQFASANGSVTNGATVAWKVVDQNGALSLEPGWTSRDMVSPLTPMVLNGVVFAVASGEFRTRDVKMTAAQRVQRSTPAVLYALDGVTGKELWNSGKTIASFVHGGGLSGGSSQIYLGTHDGTLYAFGFPMEH